jgi:SsrA-binding protein
LLWDAVKVRRMSSDGKPDAGGRKIVASNRKVRHDYHLLETYEAGLVLVGSEIKSIRANRVNLRDGYVVERGGELWLMNVHVAPYEQAGVWGHKDPIRPRKLLMHKKEIRLLMSAMRESGKTVVPTELYLKRGRAKIAIAVAVGKKTFDKRQDIAKRDAAMDIRRAVKERYQE